MKHDNDLRSRPLRLLNNRSQRCCPLADFIRNLLYIYTVPWGNSFNGNVQKVLVIYYKFSDGEIKQSLDNVAVH